MLVISRIIAIISILSLLPFFSEAMEQKLVEQKMLVESDSPSPQQVLPVQQLIFFSEYYTRLWDEENIKELTQQNLNFRYLQQQAAQTLLNKIDFIYKVKDENDPRFSLFSQFLQHIFSEDHQPTIQLFLKKRIICIIDE